jgi:hypothetical protein
MASPLAASPRTVSLGIGPIMPASVADQATWLVWSDRDWPSSALANCTPMARLHLAGDGPRPVRAGSGLALGL